MRTSRMRIGLGAAGLLLSLAVLASPTVSAKKDDGQADARIQAMTVELKKLEVADTKAAATSEIGKAEALRDKARSLMGERKEREALQMTLEELEATVALAGGKIKEAGRSAELKAEKDKLHSLESALEEARTRVAALEKEQADIEKKLGGGK